MIKGNSEIRKIRVFYVISVKYGSLKFLIIHITCIYIIHVVFNILCVVIIVVSRISRTRKSDCIARMFSLQETSKTSTELLTEILLISITDVKTLRLKL